MLSIQGLPFVKFVSPEFIKDFPMTWGVEAGLATASAASPPNTRSCAASGRRPAASRTTRISRLQRRVAFIGSEVARKMFGNVPPVGQRMRIGGMAFEVVGVQREKVQLSNYMRSDKESVFIPYTTAGAARGTPSTRR